MNSVNHAIYEVICFFKGNEVSVSCDSFGKPFGGFRTKKKNLVTKFLCIFNTALCVPGDFQFPNDAYFLVSKLI